MKLVVKRNGQTIKEYDNVSDIKLLRRNSKHDTYRIEYTYLECETIKIPTDCDFDIDIED